MKCSCGEFFEDEDAAMDHVKERHTEQIDECLQEYIFDAEQDAYEDLIDESD